MKSLSVSELTTCMECERKRHFKYDLRLASNSGGGTGWQQASGQAVHYVVEQCVRQWAGKIPHKDDVNALIDESLRADYGDSDRTEANVKKYTPGVRRAVNKVPEWVWREQWYTEHDITGKFGECPCQEQVVFHPELHEPHCTAVELRGRPDLYHVGDTFVELVDVKTTQHKPLEFMMWTPQLRFYSAMLTQKYPGKLVRYRYLCVPTQGESPEPEAASWPFKPKAYVQAEAEIVYWAARTGADGFRNPHYSRACDWCEFKDICMGVVTGADYEGIIKEEYHEREHHT